MYILKPVVHETIWGGDKLKRYTGEYNGKIGHLYMVNGHSGMSNMIMNGEYSGKKLADIFKDKKNEWNMVQYEEFPLTIALVDATNDLSIQVHPDDIAAEKLEHKKIGKKESWLFLNAPDSGWIYGGCACQTKEDIQKAIDENRMKDVTDHICINRNDYVCVDAGTLHAMTAGSLVYEIEYGSNYTYRFYDYDRVDDSGIKRELHIDKALYAINTQKRPKVQPSVFSGWISEEFYEICRMQSVNHYMNRSREIECIAVLDGSGKEEGVDIKSGMSILLLPGEKIEASCFNEVIVARLVSR